MRYRRVKAATEKFELLSEYVLYDAEACKGKWHEVFKNQNPIFLEMGCGKGQFIIEKAMQHPDCNFIGVEGQERVLLRAAQKGFEQKLQNVKFIGKFLHQLEDCFDKAEIAGLYLNFSDPWPKARHAKRRLVHGRYLNQYRGILPADGKLQFKTDNDLLFDFSLEELVSNDYHILELTYDLHQSGLSADAVTTEYEDKFKGWGKKIKYLKAGLNRK